ncbi:putative permease [Vanrija pseudolonga]|uniref:Purtative permease n=1 Tax=Vanrija pseudolonga TaxID=143232 RepID=A0AAF0XZW5_9TREE|nr:purtative permease [Vanrija pseudolonga]
MATTGEDSKSAFPQSMANVRQGSRPGRFALPKEESCIAPENVWSNKDMDPSPAEHRTWTAWTFFLFWLSELWYAGQWATVASFVELGLTWWESCLAVFVGAILVALAITANGIVGATIHTPFAVTSRATFGYWGSKFVVFSRCVVALFWLSINSWSGGQLVSLMIEAIWPQYARLHNSVPASQGATTRDFVSFLLFWILQFPFIFIHPSKLKWVFNVKAIVVPIVAVGTLIWAVKKAGPNASAALSAPGNRVAPGVPRFVAFMTSVTAVQGTWATLSVNIGDFSRYCKSPNSNWTQVWAFPFFATLVSVFSAISATCCYAVYGEVLYQPYLIIAKWNTSPGGRAAMFLGALAWALSNITTNITANSISAANDLCSLAPKYINIRRGQFIAVTVGVWGFVPWKVLDSASNFLTFMASYSIVLAPIAALMAFDFFVIKGRKYDIYELYRPDGIYRYFGGWNWRTYIALAVAIAPNLPGMVAAINNKVNIGNIKYIYMVSNIAGDAIALFVYYVLHKIWPAKEALIDVAVHDVLPLGEEEKRARGDSSEQHSIEVDAGLAAEKA